MIKLTLLCSIFGSVKKITQKLQTNYLSLNLRKCKAVIEANFSKGLAAVFHEKLCPHCQSIPDFTRCVLLAYLVSYERCICKSFFSCPALFDCYLFHIFCKKMHNIFFRQMDGNDWGGWNWCCLSCSKVSPDFIKLFLSCRQPVQATKTWLEYAWFNGPSPINNQNNVFLFSQVRCIASMGTDLHRDQEGPDLRPKVNLGGSRWQNGVCQFFL